MVRCNLPDQADLLAELVSRHTDTQCGAEFRDRLLRIPVAQRRTSRI